MKKYLQVTIILAIFFALVWWQNHHNNDSGRTVTARTTPFNSTNNSLTTANNSSSTNNTTSSSSSSTATSQYKDGTYTGAVEDAFYGNVQVQITISGGKITSAVFLQHPNDNGTSQRINAQADPILDQQAIQAQSANIDGVSGASATTNAFIQSLSTAIEQAQSS